MKNRIADRIREHWSSLTRSDRLVARRILSEYPSAGLKTLAELAGRAGVSAPSVIRCVKKLGYSSYPEFQAALRDEVQEAFDELSKKDADGRTGDMNEAEAAYTRSVRRTVKLSLDAELEQLAALLARSKSSVLCLGGRVSQAVAMVFQAQLLRLRRNVELVSPNPIERAERLIDVSRNDIVVLFDYAPYDTQTASFANLAAERKASIVCFTDIDQSPVTEWADFVIAADTKLDDGRQSLAAALCSAELALAEVRVRIGARARSRSLDISSVPDVGLDSLATGNAT